MANKPKTLKEVAEARAAHRRECRAHADVLTSLILEHLDGVPLEQQAPVWSMVQTELQVLLKHSRDDGS